MQITRKIISILLILTIVFTSFITALGYEGLGNIKYQEDTYIGPNVYYENQVAVHPVNGIEHCYTIDLKSTDGAIMPYVFTGMVTSKYTLSNMIKWVKQEGYQVIAGINGDFYDTATGIPLGMSIHDGKIKTSGLNAGYAVGFNNDGKAFIGTISVSYSVTVNDDTIRKASIGYFNESQGAANALHLYNRQYATTTKTKGNNFEVVANVIGNDEPVIGGNITAKVSAVLTNSRNAPIGQGQIVLSSVNNGAYAQFLSEMVVGDTITIDVKDTTANQVWSDVKEAIGAHDVIARNGKVTATSNSRQPRTAIGIKEDGSIMLYVVDGRQSSHSNGLGMMDVAKYLINRGCVHAVNLDGGGSSTVSLRMPGDYDPARVNKPSDKRERAVANGLILVSTQKGSGMAENLHIYPLTKLMMPGASFTYTQVKATDSMFVPVSVPKGYSFSVEDNDFGSVTPNGTFTAGKEPEEGIIRASVGNATGTAKIRIIKNIEFSLTDANILIKPGGSKNIGVKASWSGLPVVSQNNLFNWSCDEKIGTITQNGVFTASNVNGSKGNIYVEYNGSRKAIYTEVGKAITFSDVGSGHWASKYIYELASKGIVTGVGGGKFMPEAPVTRAQFIKILAGDTNVSSAKSSGFKDVKDKDWYAPYINWAFENGIVSGVTESTFAPNAEITREQMCIMILNYANYSKVSLESSSKTLSFTDAKKINTWSNEAVEAVVKAGIMNGRPDGSFDPQGKATRAESSKVIYVLFEKVKNNSNE